MKSKMKFVASGSFLLVALDNVLLVAGTHDLVMRFFHVFS